MDNEKTFETMDLTDSEEITEDPVIESVEVIPEDLPEEIEENIEETQDQADGETDGTAGGPEETAAEPEIDPDYVDMLNARFSVLEDRITALFERLESVAGILNNINEIEESRAAGPTGFFKPVENGAPDKGELPYIEKRYI